MRYAKRFLIVCVTVVALALPGASLFAQDDSDTPEPVVQTVPVADNGLDFETGVIRLSEALGWLVLFLGVLETQGMAVSAFLEETIKPALNKLVDMQEVPWFGKYGKVLILGAAAFGFGLWENTSGNVNLLANTPYPYFEQMGHLELAMLHGGLSILGAFVGHSTWEIIGGYTRRAKAALDAFSPMPKA